MKRSAVILSFALLAVSLLRVPDRAVAQMPDMTGSYVLDTQASDNVDRKIDELVKECGSGRILHAASSPPRTCLLLNDLPSPIPAPT